MVTVIVLLRLMSTSIKALIQGAVTRREAQNLSAPLRWDLTAALIFIRHRNSIGRFCFGHHILPAGELIHHSGEARRFIKGVIYKSKGMTKDMSCGWCARCFP